MLSCLLLFSGDNTKPDDLWVSHATFELPDANENGDAVLKAGLRLDPMTFPTLNITISKEKFIQNWFSQPFSRCRATIHTTLCGTHADHVDQDTGDFQNRKVLICMPLTPILRERLCPFGLLEDFVFFGDIVLPAGSTIFCKKGLAQHSYKNAQCVEFNCSIDEQLKEYAKDKSEILFVPPSTFYKAPCKHDDVDLGSIIRVPGYKLKADCLSKTSYIVDWLAHTHCLWLSVLYCAKQPFTPDSFNKFATLVKYLLPNDKITTVQTYFYYLGLKHELGFFKPYMDEYEQVILKLMKIQKYFWKESRQISYKSWKEASQYEDSLAEEKALANRCFSQLSPDFDFIRVCYNSTRQISGGSHETGHQAIRLFLQAALVNPSLTTEVYVKALSPFFAYKDSIIFYFQASEDIRSFHSLLNHLRVGKPAYPLAERLLLNDRSS